MADPTTTKAAEDLRAALVNIGRRLKIVALSPHLDQRTAVVLRWRMLAIGDPTRPLQPRERRRFFARPQVNVRLMGLVVDPYIAREVLIHGVLVGLVNPDLEPGRDWTLPGTCFPPCLDREEIFAHADLEHVSREAFAGGSWYPDRHPDLYRRLLLEPNEDRRARLVQQHLPTAMCGQDVMVDVENRVERPIEFAGWFVGASPE